MTLIFALLQKIGGLFVSPHLPLDRDYAYAARHVEAERQRKAHISRIGLIDR